MGPPARGDNESGLGVGIRNPLGRILELEPVGENQVVALGTVGPEGLLLFAGGSGLHMAHRCPQRVPDHEEPGIGSCIPGGVGDGPGGDETNAKGVAAMRGSGRTRGNQSQQEYSMAPVCRH